MHHFYVIEFINITHVYTLVMIMWLYISLLGGSGSNVGCIVPAVIGGVVLILILFFMIICIVYSIRKNGSCVCVYVCVHVWSWQSDIWHFQIMSNHLYHLSNVMYQYGFYFIINDHLWCMYVCAYVMQLCICVLYVFKLQMYVFKYEYLKAILLNFYLACYIKNIHTHSKYVYSWVTGSLNIWQVDWKLLRALLKFDGSWSC